MHIVFFGPEGSGKGTQAKLVAEKLRVPHLVSGDLVRNCAGEDQGIMGKICRDALQKGHYVADSEMYVLWKRRFKEPDTQKGWVSDGFPRNLTQAEFLARKVEKYGHTIDIVFYLDVSPAESLKRLLKRGRTNPDGSLHDSPQRIAERLKHYNKGKDAVLRYYKKRGLLVRVNGEQPVARIHQEIMKKVRELEPEKEFRGE